MAMSAAGSLRSRADLITTTSGSAFPGRTCAPPCLVGFSATPHRIPMMGSMQIASTAAVPRAEAEETGSDNRPVQPAPVVGAGNCRDAPASAIRAGSTVNEAASATKTPSPAVPTPCSAGVRASSSGPVNMATHAPGRANAGRLSRYVGAAE